MCHWRSTCAPFAKITNLSRREHGIMDVRSGPRRSIAWEMSQMSEMSNRINESGVRVRLIRPMRRLVAIGMKYAVRADRSEQGYGFAHGFTKYSTLRNWLSL